MIVKIKDNEIQYYATLSLWTIPVYGKMKNSLSASWRRRAVSIVFVSQ